MKKNIKIVFILTILVIISFLNFSTFGVDIDNIKYSDFFDALIKDDTMKVGSIIYSVLTSVGIAISVTVLAILGIKYMMGSVEERAEYKKSMMPYIIGSVLVFSASTIANIIYRIIL